MAATPHHSNVGHIVQITDYKTVQWLPHHIIPMWGTLTDHILAAGHSTGNLLAHAHQWMRVQFNSVSSVQQTFIFHKQYNFSGWLWVNFSKNSTLLLHPPPPPPSVNVHLPMQMEHNFSHKQQCNKLHTVMSFDKNLQSFQPQGNINMTSPNIHYYNYHCSAEDTHKKKCVQLGTHFYRMFLLGPHKLWFHSSGWGCDCWHHTLVLPSWGWCGLSVAMPVKWGDYLALQQTNKKPPSSSLSYTQHTHTQTNNNKTKQTKQQQPQNKHTNTHV